VADVNGDGTDDVLVVDGRGNILYRQGIPGQPGTFEPPVTVNTGFPSRDIALVTTGGGPVLASVDARDDAISLYAWRDGGFLWIGSLTTGQLPAQIIAADLNDNGLTDLVVRNAGDGTLTVFFAKTYMGPINPQIDFETFLPPVTLPVGLGVSDVRAVDTTASGALDLVVTNKLTGQVGILYNLGDGAFAPPVHYRAGTGLSAIDPGSTPEVTSLEATAGVAAGPLTPGGPTDLVTINPGSNTLDVLAGLGGGRFANPMTIDTPSPAQVVRVADFTGNGIPDVAVLTTNGVSTYLGNGKGGFAPPVTYDAGVDPTGLTVADLLGNGKLDLLVGNVYGDVLILVGNGDGTFRPFEPVKAAIALAVADLTGNGARDFVFADQSLNRVTVIYGSPSQNSTSPQVVGNQATGVLAPGAVKLADLNGDGIPDLIVANSGGNNVLVYPGLGNGQFGPPVGGTAGFPVGTDPTGLAVADLPDPNSPDHKPLRALLVADTGSNDVSVLLSQGSGSSWTMIPGPRVQTDAGPVAVAVGNLLGGTQTDLAVANSGADNVQIFPSVGGGFFNDQAQATKTYAVGQAPSSLFLGNFNGLGQELATLNAGSNDGTLITGLGSASPRTQTFATGGDSPTSGFAGDFTGNGFTDLVVGNNGDGHLALLLGGASGLSLSQTLTSAEAPNPTGLSFAGVSGGLLSFYVSTAGRDAAMNLAFDLSGGPGSEAGLTTVAVAPSGESSLAAVLTQATTGSVQQVSQLLSFSGTTLNLAATLLTVSALSGNFESESGGGAVGTVGLGQQVGQPKGNGGSSGSGEEPSAEAEGSATAPPAPAQTLPPWERLSIGLEQAWEAARAAIRELESQTMAGDRRRSAVPAVSRPPRPPVLVPAQSPTRAGTETRSNPAADAVLIAPASETSDRGPAATRHVIDAALQDLGVERAGDGPSAHECWGFWDVLAASRHTGTARALVAVVASASAVGAAGTLGARWIRRKRPASTGLP
jgi:FG-GAP-like repeat